MDIGRTVLLSELPRHRCIDGNKKALYCKRFSGWMLVHLQQWELDVVLLLQPLYFLEIVPKMKELRASKGTVHLASLEWSLKLLAGMKRITSKLSIHLCVTFCQYGCHVTR